MESKEKKKEFAISLKKKKNLEEDLDLENLQTRQLHLPSNSDG